MVICLDPGHSYGLNGKGKDPGAVNPYLGIKESVIALEIANRLANMLADKDHVVIFTRDNGDNNITLKKRCEIANESKCDIFVSIHLNSSDNSKANGIETLHYDSSRSQKLASLVQEKLIKATGARDRGTKIRNDLYVLKHTHMPAILVETGFISHKEEGLKLNDPQYQILLCKAILEGLEGFDV